LYITNTPLNIAWFVYARNNINSSPCPIALATAPQRVCRAFQSASRSHLTSQPHNLIQNIAKLIVVQCIFWKHWIFSKSTSLLQFDLKTRSRKWPCQRKRFQFVIPPSPLPKIPGLVQIICSASSHLRFASLIYRQPNQDERKLGKVGTYRFVFQGCSADSLHSEIHSLELEEGGWVR
jgi:hypothetical protein